MGWLRVGEREEVPPGRGGQFLRVPGTQPDVCLVISHAHRVQNRRVAPEGAVLIQHSDSGAPTTNSPQTMYASCQGLTLRGLLGSVIKVQNLDCGATESARIGAKTCLRDFARKRKFT